MSVGDNGWFLYFVTNINLADGDVAYRYELRAGFIINLKIGYLCGIVRILKIEYHFEFDIFRIFRESPPDGLWKKPRLYSNR